LIRVLLKKHESKDWIIVADLNQSAVDVAKIIKELSENPSLD
jgi:hypothetical protein